MVAGREGQSVFRELLVCDRQPNDLELAAQASPANAETAIGAARPLALEVGWRRRPGGGSERCVDGGLMVGCDASRRVDEAEAEHAIALATARETQARPV